MDDIQKFFENQAVIGWIAPIVVAAVIGIWGIILRKLKEHRIGMPFRKYNKGPVDVFKTYCENNRIQSIASYGDRKAIETNTEIEQGKIKIESTIDLRKRPKNNINRNFVMILVQYTPKCNMSYFYKKGYSLLFDIKSEAGICGVQLEIKDINGGKVINQYVPVTKEFKQHSFQLKEYSERKAWKEIKEICFTIFLEEEYISADRGDFEIRNCMLKIENNEM